MSDRNVTSSKKSPKSPPTRKRRTRPPRSTVSPDIKKANPKATRKNDSSEVDIRKQLFNGGRIGDIEKIMVSLDRIVKLNGILFDIDPDKYQEDGLLGKVSRDPRDFYKQTLRPMLKRHPTLAKCEVVMTGTGLHALLWLDPAVEFHDKNERLRWAAIVEVVQAALPIDPDQPGIVATTRKLGSINSKNGAKVVGLYKGEKVSPEEILKLFEEIRSAPFKTVMGILTGEDRLSPCPFCGAPETSLRTLPHVGDCYGSCGRLQIKDLYELVLTPRKVAKAGQNKTESPQPKKKSKKRKG